MAEAVFLGESGGKNCVATPFHLRSVSNFRDKSFRLLCRHGLIETSPILYTHDSARTARTKPVQLAKGLALGWSLFHMFHLPYVSMCDLLFLLSLTFFGFVLPESRRAMDWNARERPAPRSCKDYVVSLCESLRPALNRDRIKSVTHLGY